jgi:phospholipid transport system substrate-binding protein
MMLPLLLSRRALLGSLAGLAIRPAQAQQMDIARATTFVNKAGQDLVNAINDQRLNQAQRRDRVAGILRSAIDIEGTGRFILGRYVRQASPAELQEYLKLFDEIIIRNLSARFGEYRGVKFSLGRSQQRTEEDALVSTLVERPNTPAFTLDWRVAEVNGRPKVVDVIAEGTSLRLTTRSEYAAVIQRNGGRVAALLDAMRGQIAQLAAREGS